jgi:proteasome activator subunit 4
VTPRLALQVQDIPFLTVVWPTFASSLDWLVSLFHRVLALFENLPEEGGKKNTTGGKPEESALKSVKGMLDVVCLHLSDSLFDLVLNLVFDYAMTNAKSNAVRPFGQLVACLARVRPEQTIAKFLLPCVAQIEEELKHGASSVRTTSTHAAVPSDTTLHWSTYVPRWKLVSLHSFFERYGNSSWLSGLRWFCSELDQIVHETLS